MKYLSSLLFLSFLTMQIFAQIPNGSFENWGTIENYASPEGWETNQDSLHQRLHFDSSATDGTYSMKMFPSAPSAWTNCNSVAQCGFSFDNNNSNSRSLYFDIKTESLNNNGSSFTWITLYLFSGDQYIKKIEWLNHEIFDEFKMIEIPFNDPSVDSVQIQILAGATNGPADGCHDHSNTWIDRIELGESSISSINDTNENPINIYPIPSNGEIKINQAVETIGSYQILGYNGSILEKGKIHNNTIKIHSKGLLMLLLFDNFGNVETKRIINL